MPRSRNSNLKKIIVDYKKLNETILDLLVEKYPYGYDDDDIIRFKNTQNENIECVEVSDGETLFMVKISTKLERKMENHDLNEDLYEGMDSEDFDY